MRLSKTDELLQYRRRIGDAEYRKQYLALYRFAEQSTRRNSGKEYKNTKNHLQSLKEKYKNGVSKKVIDEMLDIRRSK